MPYLPMTEYNRRDMLKVIGVSGFGELIACIPESVRLSEPLDLPAPLSEYEITNVLHALSGQNEHAGASACFLGGGAYDHFIPAAVGHLTSRSEFYTAYTPYQPEVAQGNLQAIYEYQSLICRLTGMDAANASMYDGASALAESALLMHGQTRRQTVLISKSVHPWYRRVAAAYCNRAGIEVIEIPMRDGVTDPEVLAGKCSEATAGLLIQSPNFFGLIESVEAAAEAVHAAGGLLSVSANPVSLGILKPPGESGADVVTGEGQVLGLPLNFGGPYLGVFAVKQPLIRRMPGRLAGVTLDTEGRRGFVLTLQTREQHIRREKATSSICTNQQLCALSAAIYLSLMGKQGLARVAELCAQKAHYLSDAIQNLPGAEILFPTPFFNEFAVQLSVPAKQVIDRMRSEKIFAGIDLGRFDADLQNSLLIAVTEKRTRGEMDRYVSILRDMLS